MPGFTLTELVVTLLVLSLLTALAGLAVGSAIPPTADPWKAEVAHARDSAIRSGKPVVIGGDSATLLLPDGRAIGPGLDPLTGEMRRDSR